MKKFIVLLVFLGVFIGCDTTVDDVINSAEGETTQMEQDTSLMGKVTTWALFQDTILEETGIIIKVAVDSSLLSTIATSIAGQELSVDAEGKVGVIKRMSADSVILMPINLPAKYLDKSMLNSYVKILYSPANMDIPQKDLQNAKIIALRGITEYSPSNISLDNLND